MKKPYTFNQRSVLMCKVCGRTLKKNLLAKNPTADRCFKCHKGQKVFLIEAKAKLKTKLRRLEHESNNQR
jgi:hypothetical protein